MKHHSRRNIKLMLLSLATIVAGILINVLLSYASYELGLPVYWDTIGTIGVAGISGFFPAVLVAMVTNLVCGIFNDNAIYFGIVNVLIAIVTVWFFKKRSFRSAKNIVIFILILGALSGITSAIIQWGIIGGPENASISALLESMGFTEGIGKFLMFLLLNVLLNTFDKALCFGAAVLIWHFLPRELQDKIRNSAWRQRPLTKEERQAIGEWKKNTIKSAKTRMTVTLIALTFAAGIITAWIGVTLYYNNAKKEKIEIAQQAAKFAASVVDADKIGEYLTNGESTPGYKETEDMLYKIRDNAPGVEYLYLLKVNNKECTFIFDLDAKDDHESYAIIEDAEGYSPGETVELDDEFYEYMDEMLVGKEIPPIESKGNWNWVVTSYYPVFDSSGNFVCYAGADASISYIADYMRDFAARVLLVMIGIIVLIVAYGIWVTDYYTVFPIEGIGIYVKDFISAGDNQDELDKMVRKLRSVDIRTEDEVEKLYNDICDMALNQTEQLRSIRRLSEDTAQMQDGLIITMADLVENRDSDTGAHIQKTSAYVKIIVNGLKEKGYYAEKITPKFMSDVVRSAPLHDIGKINISDTVLNKPGKLTDEEFEIMKTHTTAGMKIMEKAIETVGGENYLKEARNMAAYHHERWDGKGYPEGLHGEVIPLSARIMAVADVFDALTSPRVYKPAFPLEKALSIIQEEKGKQFDPKCVEVFMDSLAEVKVVLKKYNKDA